MRTWKHTIKFTHFWDCDDIDIFKKAKLAADSVKLIQRSFQDDVELDNIIDDFNDIAKGDGQEAISEFDNVMYILYDWADSNDVWVKTFV
jgi:hypothetical protein